MARLHECDTAATTYPPTDPDPQWIDGEESLVNQMLAAWAS